MRGFLGVWSTTYSNTYDAITSDGAVLGQLMDVLITTIPSRQSRWYKGVASVLLTHAMVSCGRHPFAHVISGMGTGEMEMWQCVLPENISMT